MKKFRILITFLIVLIFSFAVSARELPGQSNVSVNKIWTINLNKAIDNTTLQDITVKDHMGNNIDIEKMVTSDGKQIAVQPKCGAWGRGETYTIEVNNVKSMEGNVLKNPISLTFSTVALNFTGSGTYAEDENYIFTNYSKAVWQVQGGYTGYSVYGMDIEDVGSNDIYIYLYTDTAGIGNILASSDSVKAMDYQLQTIVDYMKAKYPNKAVSAGLYFKETLNKYPEGADSKYISYIPSSGKYLELMLLGMKDSDGNKYFINDVKGAE